MYKENKMQAKGSRHSGAWKKLLQASCRSPSRYSQMCLQPYSMGEQGSGRSAQSLWWKYQIRKYREHKYKWKTYRFQSFRNIIPMLCLQQNGWIGSAQSLWKKTQTSGVGIYCWKFGAIHMGVVFIQNVFVTGPFPLVWVSGPCEGWPTQFWCITLHFVDFGKNLLTFALGVSSSSSSGEVGANKYNGRMGSDAHGWREWDGSGMEDFCRAQPDHTAPPLSLPPLLLPPSLLPF